MRKWLLPEYIEDILPVPARRIEALRRGMLDLFERHCYQLVLPPMLEYVDVVAFPDTCSMISNDMARQS